MAHLESFIMFIPLPGSFIEMIMSFLVQLKTGGVIQIIPGVYSKCVTVTRPLFTAPHKQSGKQD